MKITDFVKKDIENFATFQRFRAGELYYSIQEIDGSRVFEFSVSAEDLKGATVSRVERSIVLMRYIRLGIENNSLNHIHTIPGLWDCDVCAKPQKTFHAVVIEGKKHCPHCNAKWLFTSDT